MPVRRRFPRRLPVWTVHACLQHSTLRADEYGYIGVRAVDSSAKEYRIVWGEDGGHENVRGLRWGTAGHPVRADVGRRSIVWSGEAETSADSAANEAD